MEKVIKSQILNNFNELEKSNLSLDEKLLELQKNYFNNMSFEDSKILILKTLNINEYEYYTNEVDNKLQNYIENEIFPLYEKNDKGHGILHIKEVIRRSFALNETFKLGLDEKLSYDIGLLHDYARFPQWKKFASFDDYSTFDHADEGARLLFEEGGIKAFDIKKEDYLLIKLSIKFHNKFAIDENYLKEEIEKDKTNTHSFDEILSYCKLSRDGDKMDLFNMISQGDLSVHLNQDGYTPSIMTSIKNHSSVVTKDMRTKLDRLFCFIAFLFDINYRESIEEMSVKDYFECIKAKYGNILNEKDSQTLSNVMQEVLPYFNDVA